jgi:hypothetical protein
MGAKRTKVKKLVLTDGTWYYDNSSAYNSYFIDDQQMAWDFQNKSVIYKYDDASWRKRLQWELDTWTHHEPIARRNYRRRGIVKTDESVKIDRSKFVLKWLTVIETVRLDEFCD